VDGALATLSETIQVFSLLVVSTALGTWAVIDAIRTPEADFRAAGRSRTIWIAVLVVLGVLSVTVMFVLFVAVLAVACYYLVRVRPQVRHRSF